MIVDCRASILCCGVGKAGHIARKSPRRFPAPARRVIFSRPRMRFTAISARCETAMSSCSSPPRGESDEILRMLSIVKKLDHPVDRDHIEQVQQARTIRRYRSGDGQDRRSLPAATRTSASTTAMLALGDALALSVMKLRNFTADDFAVFHPAGQIGRKLIRVGEAMTFRRGENLPVAVDSKTVGEVLQEVECFQTPQRRGYSD